MAEQSYPSYRPPGRAGVIATVVLCVVVALCLGGGLGAYVLVQNTQPRGATDPTAAVNGFLGAVFGSHSADAAAEFVCARSRDVEELTEMVEGITAFEAQFEAPRTSWDTQPVEVTGRTAATTVRLLLIVDDAQVAEQRLRMTLVEERGWFVCDVERIS
jgi:hypothetical protein